jgi:DNA sulfur modification protein DndD
MDHEMEEARGRAQAKLDEFQKSELSFENSKMKLAAIPSVDALAKLEQERSELGHQVALLTGEQNSEASQLDRLRRELERKCVEIERMYQSDAQSTLDDGDTNRVLRHSQKVEETLSKFKQAMISRHLHRLEALVLDSFIQLLRKKALVSELSINPQTFDLELKNKNGEVITPDRLSAGERQLLAISVLWGLARASGRPLPMIVDTPLGRLDSSHRKRLVSHYFPHASHQVILLSTDEEISGRYYQSLMPFVGRSYQLVHDEELGGTTVKLGYFEEMQNVH